jgi:hypothetical protein
MQLEVLIAFGLAVIGAVALAVAQSRQRGSQRAANRSAHGVAAGLLVLLATAPLTWTWVLMLGESRLPVERPASPGGMGCADDEPLGALTVLAVLAIFYAVTRGIPFLIAFAIARWRGKRRPGRALPDGRTALGITGGVALGIAALVLVRLLLGGTAPDRFTTYGAITPEHASGWRADWLIGRAATGAFEAMPDGEPIYDEAEYVPSTYRGDMPLPIPTSHWKTAPGAKIWVAGEPLLVEVRGGQPPFLRPVRHRNETQFPHERRAHFETRPRVAPADDGWVLAEQRADGSRFAVLLDDDGDQRAATVRTAGLLLVPPLWPLLAGLPLAALVAAMLYRRRRDPDRPLAALTGAWLLAELAIWLGTFYRPYF